MLLSDRMQRFGNRVAIESEGRRMTYSEIFDNLKKENGECKIDECIENGVVEGIEVKHLDTADPFRAIIGLIEAMESGRHVTLENVEELSRTGGRVQTINPWVGSDTAEGACLLTASSGSTGGKKYLWRPLCSWEKAYGLHMEHFGFREGIRVWIDGSLTYTGNLHTLLAVFWCGGTVLLTQGHSLSKSLNHIMENGADCWFMIPSKLKTISLLLERHKRSSAIEGDVSDGITYHQMTPESILTVGEPLHGEIIGRLKELFPKTWLHAYYGSAELGHVSFRSDLLSDIVDWDVKDVGTVFDGVEMRIFDGLIHVRSPYDCFGMKNEAYHTSGDLGEMISERLHLAGRDISIINRHGIKIHLDAILENVLANGLVEDAAVRIRKSASKSTYDLLVVVKSEHLSKDMLLEGIPKYKRPSAIVYLKEIPHNGSGKTRRYIME